MTRYTLPELPYDHTALEPHYSARLLELHHDKHHAAYVTGANATLEKLAQARDQGDFAAINQLQKSLAFHLSGHVLHSLFWRNMSPRGGGEPDGELARAINEFFGSFAGMRGQLTEAALNVQGSGWGALGWEPLGKRLVVEQVYDHQGEGSSSQLVEQKSGPSQQVWQRCVAADTVQQLVSVSRAIGPGVPARMSTGRTFVTSSGRGESSPVTLSAPDRSR